MPYDIDLLPPTTVGGTPTRSAYLRFARPEQGQECAIEMKDVTIKGATIDVRPAWEKLFPVLVEGGAASDLQALLSSLRTQGLDVVDSEVIPGGDGGDGDGGSGGGGAAALVRFATAAGAEKGLKYLQARAGGGGGGAVPAWKDFRIDVVNLPAECGEADLRRLVHLTMPARAVVGGPAGDSGRRRGSLSFATRGEAELAYTQLSGAGLPDLKLRKAWAVYRLTVKGLPLDTTEADVREALRGYEPYRVDFSRSKKGNLKGEAVLRFAAYDQLRAAIARLYGRDSPLDEAESSARWETAADGLSFDDPLPALEEAVAAAEAAGATGGAPGRQLEAAVQRALRAEDGEAREVMDRTLLTEEDEVEAKRHGALVAGGQEGEEEEEEEEEEEQGAAVGDVNPFGVYPEGRWVKMLVDTDTTQKIVKGGQILSYRALVVVGNIKGCGGWGIGKGASLEEAKTRAYRAAKKNLIHVDLYRNRCVTTPLYGKHNNCRIYIQAGHPLKHHKEGRMINDILRIFGVESGEARSVGRRNPYSVVRAVFDAMSKHVGVEEVARKRGRRLISVSKARYLNL
jgi:ribosomal protein S5